MPVSWDDWPESARGIFQGFRSAKGEDLVLQRNLFRRSRLAQLYHCVTSLMRRWRLPRPF